MIRIFQAESPQFSLFLGRQDSSEMEVISCAMLG